jgi:hypothetical protein
MLSIRTFKILKYVVLGLALWLVSCNGVPETTKPVSFDPVSSTLANICDLSTDDVGETVHIQGEIIFIDTTDPMGRFMELSSDGCQIGVFIENRLLESWDASLGNLLLKGNWIEVEGQLVSFENQLVVDIRGQLPVAAEPPSTQEASLVTLEPGLERWGYEAAPARHRLEVPHVYSGFQEYPAICYLGAFAMVAQYELPSLSFADVIALSGAGTAAAVVESPETESGFLLTNGVWEASIGLVAGNLGADLIVASSVDGDVGDPFNPFGLHLRTLASEVWQFSSSQEALDTLRRVVAAGHPVEVHLNLLYVADDFAQQTDEWAGRAEPASHYMTVTGYDEDSIYLHDPTEVSSDGMNLATSVEHFLQAWETAAQGPNMPPVGPLWMAFLASPGKQPSAQQVVSWNADFSAETPEAFRLFAGSPGKDMPTCFSQGELARAREEFSAYLESAGMAEAASFYQQSADLLTQGALAGGLNADQLNQIADLEEQALAVMASDQ